MLPRVSLVIAVICGNLWMACAYGQQTVANSELADIYSFRTFNSHGYLVYRAYDDTIRNNYSVGDIDKTAPLIPNLFNWIFDYYLADSILSLVAYKSRPAADPQKDTTVLAFFVYDVRTGQRLDSIPLLDLLYKKFDAQGFIGVKEQNGAGFSTRYLRYDRTEQTRGARFLYPRRNSEFYITRDFPPPTATSFTITFASPAKTLTAKKLRVQPERNLIIQDIADSSRYYNTNGSVNTDGFVNALDFPPYNDRLTAASRNDSTWFLVAGNTLATRRIKIPAGHTIGTAKHFMGYDDRLFLKLKSGDRTFWGMQVQGRDSADVDTALHYADILPLFMYNSIYYLLAKDSNNVKLLKYDPSKTSPVTVLQVLNNNDLEQAEIISQDKENLMCRLALRSADGQTTDIVDLDINGRTEKLTALKLVDVVSHYYITAGLLALKMPGGYWYFRKKDAFEQDLRSKDKQLEEKLNSVQPFKSVVLAGRAHLVALAEQTVSNKRRQTVYIDITDWKPLTWNKWYSNHK